MKRCGSLVKHGKLLNNNSLFLSTIKKNYILFNNVMMKSNIGMVMNRNFSIMNNKVKKFEETPQFVSFETEEDIYEAIIPPEPKRGSFKDILLVLLGIIGIYELRQQYIKLKEKVDDEVNKTQTLKEFIPGTVWYTKYIFNREDDNLALSSNTYFLKVKTREGEDVLAVYNPTPIVSEELEKQIKAFNLPIRYVILPNMQNTQFIGDIAKFIGMDTRVMYLCPRTSRNQVMNRLEYEGLLIQVDEAEPPIPIKPEDFASTTASPTTPPTTPVTPITTTTTTTPVTTDTTEGSVIEKVEEKIKETFTKGLPKADPIIDNIQVSEVFAKLDLGLDLELKAIDGIKNHEVFLLHKPSGLLITGGLIWNLKSDSIKLKYGGVPYYLSQKGQEKGYYTPEHLGTETKACIPITLKDVLSVPQVKEDLGYILNAPYKQVANESSYKDR
ncbi:hypothetical protein ABK040_004435 [Willaertia magna]